MIQGQTRVRSSHRKKSRLFLGGFLVLILLATGRFARQEVLDRRLAFAIINNRDKEAMGLLEQGANAKSLYYSPLPPDWWSQFAGALTGSDTLMQGTPLLAVALENQLQDANTGRYLPPTPDRRTLLEMLIMRGADVNAQIPGGTTPLELAVIYDCYDLVVCLLDHGADVNLHGDSDQPMLHYALLQKDRRIFFLILNRNPDLRHEIPEVLQNLSARPEYMEILEARLAQEHRGG